MNRQRGPQPPASASARAPTLNAPSGGGSSRNENCPPGLEYLMSVNSLVVQQQIELLEIVTGYETKNRYIVMNSVGQRAFYAVEDSSILCRCCCGSLRPFDMIITDNFDKQVINLDRPLSCQGCCCCCCLQKMEVSAPPGNVIGIIEELWTFCWPWFVVKNAAGDIMFYIKGDCLACRCCTDVQFVVLANDRKTEIGRIVKNWMGLVLEGFSDADNFSVTFPMNLDVKMKATLLGALFLIDYMYFEDNDANTAL